MIQEKPGQVNFATAFADFFKGYFDFSGRSTRAGYWWIAPFIVITGIIAVIIAFTITDDIDSAQNIAFLIYLVPFGMPSLTLQIRRYRDVGFTAKGAVLLLIIPITLSITFSGLLGDFFDIINIVITVQATDAFLTTSQSKTTQSLLRSK